MSSIPKGPLFEGEARDALKRGIDILAFTLKSCFGPYRRESTFKEKSPKIAVLEDGESMIKDVKLSDPYMNMGAEIGKEVCRKIKDRVGDGTKLGIILLQSLLQQGVPRINAGSDPKKIYSGMEKAVDKILEDIKRNTILIQSIEKIENISMITETQEVRNAIYSILPDIKELETVFVEETESKKIKIEKSIGKTFYWGEGYPFFCMNCKNGVKQLTDSYFLFSNKKISTVQEILPILQEVSRRRRSLIIIARELDRDVVSTLMMNQWQKILEVYVVQLPRKYPRSSTLLEEIAVLTGGRVLPVEGPMLQEKNILSTLGFAKEVYLTRDSITIIQDKERKGKEHRMSKHRKRIKEQKSRKVAKVFLGTKRESERKKNAYFFINTLHTLRLIQEGGAVFGGGMALLRAKENSKDLKLSGEEKIGAEMAFRACLSPFTVLIENNGRDSSIYLKKITDTKERMGFNVLTGRIEDIAAAQILDPACVVKEALLQALTGAKKVFYTEVIIADSLW